MLPVVLPPAPAIIVPDECRGPQAALAVELARLGIPRNVRRAVLKEVERLAGSRSEIIRPALADLARYSNAPLAILAGGLGVNALSGGGGAASSAVVTVTLKDHAVTETANSTVTFSGRTLATTGHLVIGIGTRGAGNYGITSCTMDGSGATSIISLDGDAAANTTRAALFVVASTGNASGNVVIVFGSSSARTTIGIWQITGWNGVTPTGSNIASSSADPCSASIDCAANGVIIGYGFSGVDATSSTPTALTENFDEVTGVGASTHTGLSKAYAAAQTGLTVGCDFASTTSQAFVAAAFGP